MAAAPQKLWSLDLASPSYGGGALGKLGDDLAIVFGTYFNDEHLYAVAAKDGKLLWKFKSEGGPFDASVALADVDGDGALEVIAADSQTGTLFCLDGAGKEMWKHKLPSSTDSPPAIADLDDDGHPEIVVGTMTVNRGPGRVIALDARTLKVKWEAEVPGHVQSEPALVDLNNDGVLDVIVTTWRGDKCVRALSGKDGKELWKHPMAGDMYHGVSVFRQDGIKIVATSIAGDVTLLDDKGKVIWTNKPGGYLFGPSAVVDLTGDGTPAIIVAGPKLIAYSVDGTERWQTPEYGSIARGVAHAEMDGKPTLFFGASDRKFRAAGGDGKEIWAFDATVKGHVYEGIDSGPVVGDFDGDGQLEVFFVVGKGTSDKEQRQNYGRAYCLKAGKGTDAWPMFRGNLRRTGTR
ncbi:MAG: PQQ-binding-like beta-propeller repeat protein [Gemmataceae bacterium]